MKRCRDCSVSAGYVSMEWQQLQRCTTWTASDHSQHHITSTQQQTMTYTQSLTQGRRETKAVTNVNCQQVWKFQCHWRYYCYTLDDNIQRCSSQWIPAFSFPVFSHKEDFCCRNQDTPSKWHYPGKPVCSLCILFLYSFNDGSYKQWCPPTCSRWFWMHSSSELNMPMCVDPCLKNSTIWITKP